MATGARPSRDSAPPRVVDEAPFIKQTPRASRGIGSCSGGREREKERERARTSSAAREDKLNRGGKNEGPAKFHF